MHTHIHETRIKVRYSETDQMGVVHHSRYYPWFEVARSEMLEAAVAKYSELEAMGLWLPLTTSHCDYRKPAVYDETLTIHSWIRSLKKAKIEIAYKVFKESGELAAEGYTVHPFVDGSFTFVNLKKTFPDVYEKLHAYAAAKGKERT